MLRRLWDDIEAVLATVEVQRSETVAAWKRGAVVREATLADLSAAVAQCEAARAAAAKRARAGSDPDAGRKALMEAEAVVAAAKARLDGATLRALFPREKGYVLRLVRLRCVHACARALVLCVQL